MIEGDPGYSLSVCLQLTNLKEHHEIVFAVAGSSLRAGHRCQLGGRNCVGIRRERACQTREEAEEGRLVLTAGSSSNPTEERDRDEERKSVMQGKEKKHSGAPFLQQIINYTDTEVVCN